MAALEMSSQDADPVGVPARQIDHAVDNGLDRGLLRRVVQLTTMVERAARGVDRPSG